MVDVYDNLDNYEEIRGFDQLKTENEELKIKLEATQKVLGKLQKEILQDFDALTSRHQSLLENYSSLLKTAREEIKKKTDTITRINIEKDELMIKILQGRNPRNPLKSRVNIQNKESKQNLKHVTTSKSDQKSESGEVCEPRLLDKNRPKSREELEKKEVKPVKQDHIKFDRSNTEKLHTNVLKNSSAKNDSDSEIYKENISKKLDSSKRASKIFSRRKSMPIGKSAFATPSSDEDDDNKVVQKSELPRNTNSEAENNSSDKRQKSSYASTLGNEQDRIIPKDRPVDRISRYDRYECNDAFRNRDEYEEYKYKDRYSSGRQHRSRYPYRGAEDPHRYNTRHRRAESPPYDKYSRNKSRDRRSNYDWDMDYDHRRHSNFERSKHKSHDLEEPVSKRRRMDYPRSVAEMHLDRDRIEERAFDGECFTTNHSCQSPDDVVLENVTFYPPAREILTTAVMKIDDPRLNSKRYIPIDTSDKNKPKLIAASSKDVDLVKCTWSGEYSKIQDVQTEEAVKNMYMVFSPEPSSVESGEINDLSEIYSDIDNEFKNKELKAKNALDVNIASSKPKDIQEKIPFDMCNTDQQCPKIPALYKIPKMKDRDNSKENQDCNSKNIVDSDKDVGNSKEVFRPLELLWKQLAPEGEAVLEKDPVQKNNVPENVDQIDSGQNEKTNEKSKSCVEDSFNFKTEEEKVVKKESVPDNVLQISSDKKINEKHESSLLDDSNSMKQNKKVKEEQRRKNTKKKNVSEKLDQISSDIKINEKHKMRLQDSCNSMKESKKVGEEREKSIKKNEVPENIIKLHSDKNVNEKRKNRVHDNGNPMKERMKVEEEQEKCIKKSSVAEIASQSNSDININEKHNSRVLDNSKSMKDKKKVEEEPEKLLLVNKDIVAGDLELSDDDSDTNTKVIKNDSDKPQCEKSKKPCSKQSSQRVKKGDCKKSKMENKDITAKLSDLFGDSSLITPDDLELSPSKQDTESGDHIIQVYHQEDVQKNNFEKQEQSLETSLTTGLQVSNDLLNAKKGIADTDLPPVNSSECLNIMTAENSSDIYKTVIISTGKQLNSNENTSQSECIETRLEDSVSKQKVQETNDQKKSPETSEKFSIIEEESNNSFNNQSQIEKSDKPDVRIIMKNRKRRFIKS